MKKTLAAIAVLGAFAGSAMAADVTLYGVIDMGLGYSNVKNVKADGTTTKTDSLSMESGMNSGSRFGLKGTEDLGNGYKAGFVLENGVKTDTGALETGGRLFHREALLYVQGGFGELSLGRTGALDAGTGRYNMMGSGASALGTGWWSDMGGAQNVLIGIGTRLDNAITYQSPSFAGVTLLAQASLKTEGVEKEYKKGGVATHAAEGSSDARRYYGIGAKYSAGALNAGAVVSMIDFGRVELAAGDDDTAMTYSAYVNYDFGMVKPMVAVQYFDQGRANATDYVTTDPTKVKEGQKGYGIVVGATAPIAGGLLKVTAGYSDAEGAVKTTENKDYNNIVVGAGYEYPLSKRTKVYAGAGWVQAKTDDNAGKTTKKETTKVMAGMVHSF